MKNRGKDFEKKFREDFLKNPKCVFIYRIPDQLSGYKGSSTNICDFIVYNDSKLYLIETKSHNGNTWPFSSFPQYNRMVEYVGKPGIRVGVVLWLVDKDTVVYLPLNTIKEMILEGKKSFNIKDLQNENYRVILIPSKKKRIFMDSDYSILDDLQEGD